MPVGDVPPPIRRFFVTTNAGDTAGFLACFAPGTVLTDWGRTFNGRDGVARWNESDNIGVRSKLRLIDIKTVGAAHVATVAVSGDGFNGEGTMMFTLAGGLIARLDIS